MKIEIIKQIELLNCYIWQFPVWYHIGMYHICAPHVLSKQTDDYHGLFQLCQKTWKIILQITSKIHLCLLSLLHVVEIFRKFFGIYSQKNWWQKMTGKNAYMSCRWGKVESLHMNFWHHVAIYTFSLKIQLCMVDILTYFDVHRPCRNHISNTKKVYHI